MSRLTVRLTQGQVAKWLGVSKWAVQRMVKSGRLPKRITIGELEQRLAEDPLLKQEHEQTEPEQDDR